MYSDESIEGYIYRLSEANNIQISDLQLGYPGLYDDDIKLKKFLLKIELLSAQSLTSKNLLYNFCVDRFTLPFWKKHFYSRFCPKCLMETYYHRMVWSLTHHTYCISHRVYLVEYCPQCNRKLNIQDITSGACKICKFQLVFAPTETIEKEFLDSEGMFKLEHSPYLQLKLNMVEQLQVGQRLLYYLVTKLKLIDTQLLTRESEQLVYGYYPEVKELHNFMILAFSLIQEWPNKAVLYLVNSDKVTTSRFMFEFINSFSNSKIKNVLRLTYNREQGFRGASVKFSTHLSRFDREFIPVEDIVQSYNISHHALFMNFVSRQIKTEVHPRNQLLLVKWKYIDFIAESKNLVSEVDDFISVDNVAKTWSITIHSVRVLCEMLQIPSKIIFGEPCYRLLSIKKYIQEINQYITLYDLKEQFIWSHKTLINYLMKKNVVYVYSSGENSWDCVYNRKEVQRATSDLSNNKRDFMDRSNAIKTIGRLKLEAANIEVYHIALGLNHKPYYLKTDIKRIQLKSHIYRHV
jgi:hypothetical protein